MSLVEYPDSDDDNGNDNDNDNNNNDNDKRSGHGQSSLPPPPPKSFLHLYTSGPRLSANSHMLEGKTRSMAHVEGSWPSHVYIEWVPSDTQLAILESLIQSRFHIRSLLRSDLGVPQPLHISLSPTLMIKSTELEHFKQQVALTVRRFFRKRQRSERKSSRNSIKFKRQLATLPNDTETRLFVVLPLDGDSTQTVGALIDAINSVSKDYNQQQLSPEAPHVSIAWASSEHQPKIRFEPLPTEGLKDLEFSFHQINVKTGRQIQDISIDE